MLSLRLASSFALCFAVACSDRSSRGAVAPSEVAPAPTTPAPAEEPTAAPPSVRLSAGPALNGKAAAEEEGCAADIPVACNNLGSDWAEGQGGVPGKDFEKAKVYYEKACRLRSGVGCFNLGNVYRLGEAVDVDPKQAATYFEKSCDLGEAKGCTELGILYYEGKAFPRDRAKALSLLEKSCKLGSEVACKNVEVIKKSR